MKPGGPAPQEMQNRLLPSGEHVIILEVIRWQMRVRVLSPSFEVGPPGCEGVSGAGSFQIVGDSTAPRNVGANSPVRDPMG